MANLTSAELARRWGLLSEGEAGILVDLARSLPKNPIVVNIGAGAGTSGLAFLESREDLTLFSIDNEGGVNPLGGLGNERQTMQEAGFAQEARFKQVLGDSKAVAKQWPHGLVDMVFVDGDHSYEGVKGDVEAWLALVKPGGIIAFHDFLHSLYPGVTQAVGELMFPFERLAEHRLLVAFRVP